MTPERKAFLKDNYNIITWREQIEFDTQVELDKLRTCPVHGKLLEHTEGYMMSNPMQYDLKCPSCQFYVRLSLPREGT